MKILLVGMPNCGKSTLFNALTGARRGVGNRAGVSVDLGFARMRNSNALLVDLPGCSSLDSGGAEEGAALEALGSQNPDLILNVLDSCNLELQLSLSLQLLTLGVPMALVLNMADEAAARGLAINNKGLGDRLGVPVLSVSAAKRRGLAELVRLVNGGAVPPPKAGRYRVPLDAAERFAESEALVRAFVRGGAPCAVGFDRIVTHRVWGYPIMALLALLVFFCTFGLPGQWLQQGVERLLSLVPINTLTRGLAPWLSSLVTDGLWGGLCAVPGFVPQIAILFTFMALLEDSGLFARIAFNMDRLLSSLGLSGKACIPLVMGFGCTVPAAMSVRTLDSHAERQSVLTLLPYCCCSAKLPLLLLAAGRLFPSSGRLSFVLCFYLFSIVVGLLRSSRGSRGRRQMPLTLVLPPYRMPRPCNIARLVSQRVGHFLLRAGGLIVLCQLVLWLLWHTDLSLAYCQDPAQSLLYRVGEWTAPLFKPAGFTSPYLVTALVMGVAAKEALAAALMSGIGGVPLAALADPTELACFTLFALLCPPCIAALSAIKRERSGGFVGELLKGLATAYLCAVILNLVLRLVL